MPSVVFILQREDGRLLMEQRPDKDDDFFPREWLFPGGKLEDGEAPTDALMREAQEELGIAVCAAGVRTLVADEQIYYARPGEASHRLYPFLVTHWHGVVPDRVLDSDAVLAWRTLEQALVSPVECTRAMARAVAWRTR